MLHPAKVQLSAHYICDISCLSYERVQQHDSEFLTALLPFSGVLFIKPSSRRDFTPFSAKCSSFTKQPFEFTNCYVARAS